MFSKNKHLQIFTVNFYKALLIFIVALGLLNCSPLNSNEGFYDITKDGEEQYEDIYSRGKVIKKASYGERYEERRFSIVNSVLEKYKRPFTLLDVGSAQGYFSFRAAEMYPESVFVMLEGSNKDYPLISKQVLSICNLNSYLKNVIWLNTQLIPSKFIQLSQCEHFDVILALNILHWFPNNWRQILDSMIKMSQVTIVEVPPSQQNFTTHEINTYLTTIANEIIEGVPRHINPLLKTTYYIIENNKPFELERTNLLVSNSNQANYKIYYNYSKKIFKKTDAQTKKTYLSNWEPGINLLTYLVFNGAWPSRRDLINYLPIDHTHSDWMPNNMIISGNGITLIDIRDQSRDLGLNTYPYNEKLHDDVIQLILNTDIEKIQPLFDNLIEE